MKYTCVAAALAIAGFSGSAVAAQLRVINAAPGVEQLQLKAGTEVIVSNVRYKDATAYQQVKAGSEKKLSVARADGTALQLANDAELPDGDELYTLLVLPDKEDANKYRIEQFSTDKKDTNNQKARVTLINASAAVEAADLFVGTNKVHAGVNYGGHNGPDEVDVSGGALRVQNGRTDQAIPLSGGAGSITAGQSYTVVVFAPDEARVITANASSGSASASAAGMQASSAVTTASSAIASGASATGDALTTAGQKMNQAVSDMNTTSTAAHP